MSEAFLGVMEGLMPSAVYASGVTQEDFEAVCAVQEPHPYMIGERVRVSFFAGKTDCQAWLHDPEDMGRAIRATLAHAKKLEAEALDKKKAAEVQVQKEAQDAVAPLQELSARIAATSAWTPRAGQAVRDPETEDWLWRAVEQCGQVMHWRCVGLGETEIAWQLTRDGKCPWLPALESALAAGPDLTDQTTVMSLLSDIMTKIATDHYASTTLSMVVLLGKWDGRTEDGLARATALTWLKLHTES